MSVNLTTTSLVDYLKSIDGYSCAKPNCSAERKELWEIHRDSFGYPTEEYGYKGWQNTKLLKYLRDDLKPAFHDNFQSQGSGGNYSFSQSALPQGTVAGTYQKINLFTNLREFVVAAENAGVLGGVQKGQNNANYNTDYHLGYQQISGWNITTFTSYIKHYLSPTPGDSSASFVTQRKLWDAWYIDLFTAAHSELVNNNHNLNCTKFNAVNLFDLPHQQFFQTLYIADSVKVYSDLTMEQLILSNLMGASAKMQYWNEPWNMNNIVKNIYWNKPQYAPLYPWEYLQNSHIPDLPENVSTEENFKKVFTTYVKGQDLIDSCQEAAEEAWDLSGGLQKRISKSSIPFLFEKKHLYKIYPNHYNKDYKPPIFKSKLVAPDASLADLPPDPASIPTVDPQSQLAEPGNVVNIDVQAAYAEVSDDPKIYRLGLGADHSGLCYIGDILIAIPPVSIRFSEHNQSVAIPTMRTDGDPIFTNNNTIPRVDMTLYFNGDKAINEQLRPLVAMFHKMPFTSVQNTTVWKAWLGRRNSMDTKLQDEMNHFAPIPCYLENISISTLPGFPNTVQAHISLVRMNRSPYGHSARMWRHWDDAVQHSYRRTLKSSKDNTLYATERDENKKCDYMYIMDSAMKSHKVDVPDTAADGNKMMDPILTTQYPIESVPFKYTYRNILFDDGMPRGSTLYGKDIWGKDKEPLTHWPAYNQYDNDSLFITYKSAKRFRSPSSVFKTRIKSLVSNFTKIQQLTQIILSKSTEELLEIYKPINDIDFTALASTMVSSLSAIKSGIEFNKNLNKAFGSLINEVIMDTQGMAASGGFGNPFQKTQVGVCSQDNTLGEDDCKAAGFVWDVFDTWGYTSPLAPHNLLPIPAPVGNSDFMYVNEKGEVVDTMKDFLHYLNGIAGNTGFCIDHPEWPHYETCVANHEDGEDGWKAEPETDEEKKQVVERSRLLIEPIFLYMTDENTDYFGLNDLEDEWNYETVGIQLDWQTDSDTLAMHHETAQHLIDENDHIERENSRLINPRLYHFQSVLQSVSYNFANQVTPFFTASHSIPSYQHMGIPAPTANVVLRTRDERLLKIITDMKESIQEIGAQMLAGNTRLAGLGTIDVSGNIFAAGSDRNKNRNKLLSNTGPLSGHLLNSLGFGQASVQNINTRNIEGSPGWWEVSIDLIANSQNIRVLEHLNAVSAVSVPEDIHILMGDVFPAQKIDYNPLLGILEGTPEFEEREKRAQEIENLQTRIGEVQSKLTGAIQEYVNMPTATNAKKMNFLVDGVKASEFLRVKRAELQSAFALDRKLAETTKNLGFLLALSPSEFFTTYLQKDGNNVPISWELSVNSERNYTFADADGNDVNKSVESLYQDITEPMRAHMVSWLKRITLWEQEQEKNNPNYNEEYPDTFRLSATLLSYYRDYLNNVIYTISSIAHKDPTIFIDHRRFGIMPGYTNTAAQVSDALVNDPQIILQSVVLANQLRTIFYALMRRADFRDFLDEQVVPRNRAINELLDGLIKVQNSWSAGFSISLQVGQNEYNIHETDKQKAIDAITNTINIIKNSTEYLDNGNVSTINSYSLFLKQLNENIKENHPDLRLPKDTSEETGHQKIGPGFAFVDDDLGLELIEMAKIADKLKLVTFAQLAAITSGKFTEYYEDIENYLGEWKEVNGKTTYVENDQASSLNSLLSGSFIEPDGIDYNLPTSMSNAGYKEQMGETPTDEDWRILSIPMMLTSFRKLANREKEIQDAISAGANELMGKTPVAPTKQAIMDLMSSTAMLDYFVHLMTISSYLKEMDLDNVQGWDQTTDQMKKDLSATAKKVVSQLSEMDIDGYTMNKMLADAIVLPHKDSLTKSGAAHDLAVSLLEDLLQKRRDAASIATLSATGDYQGFLNYYGIGDINSVKKSFELKQKFTTYISNKNSSSMDRAFPAFKIFFIEEDGYAWQAFDDFYTYDAASEITIVESKHSASSTAVIKLSNVTQILTNGLSVGMMNEMMSITPGALLRLKVGSPVMIMVGYGADYRQLRLKFKGAVTELKPGAVLELTCQSWGAGLLNMVGASGGIDYGALSGATCMGAAVLDILAQTPGLSGLGRWEIRDPKLNDPSKVTETHLRNSWHARALNSVAGWVGDHIQIDTNIKDIVGTLTSAGGMPTDRGGLKTAWRTNNIIVKSMGNSLYDNIIINNTDPAGYGFFNWFSRAKSYMSSYFYEKSFKWHVVRQTAWDALHECALFLGDYIITTRPFNEGNDVFNNPPRETLYFGPREGQYRSKTTVPKINEGVEMDKLKDMINSIVVPPTGSAAYNKLSKSELEKLKEEQKDLNDQLLGFGKIMLSKVLDYHLNMHLIGGGVGPGFNPSSTSRFGSYRRRWKEHVLDWAHTGCDDEYRNKFKATYYTDIYHPYDLLANYRHTLLLNGFTTVERLIKDCEHINHNCYETWTGEEAMGSILAGTKSIGDMQGCSDEVAGATIVQLLNYTDEGAPPNHVVKELLLNDFEHTYDAPGTPHKSFNYTEDEWKLIEKIRRGEMPADYQDGWLKDNWSYNGMKVSNLWSYGAKGDTDFEQRHWDDWPKAKDSIFPWVLGGASLGIENADQWGECGTGMGNDVVLNTGMKGADIVHYKQWQKFFSFIDGAIIGDVKNLILNFDEMQAKRMEEYKANNKIHTYNQGEIPEGTFDPRLHNPYATGSGGFDSDMSFGRSTALSGGARGSTFEFNPVLFDLQDALLRHGNLLSAFAYSAVVDHHMVNSYEDIIDNQIVATADQMYNHVEVLFPEKPDPLASVTNAKYRSQAMISHDQDPDYLRTYQSYQKNIDYSTWHDMTSADSVIKQMESGGAYYPSGDRIVRATGLDQTVVAQSILMNQVRPMYQGTLTTIGNPHIKPWDVIHIHDDSIGMYGPIEVEQVVTHMSVSEGYTTTVVPNILVYYKGANRALDSLIMNIHTRFNSLNYWLSVAKWGILATVGLGATQSLGTFGTTSFRTFPLFGRMLGLKQLNNAAIGWSEASKLFASKNVDAILDNKKLAKKFLKKAEFKTLENIGKAKLSETTVINISVKHSQTRLSAITLQGMTKNPQLITLFDEYQRLLALNSNSANNQKMIERTTRKIAKVLGKGDITKGLAKFKTYAGRWDIASKQLSKTISVLEAAAPGNVKIKRLGPKVKELNKAIDALNKLKEVKLNGQTRGRPYVKLGDKIVAAEQKVAKLASGLHDDVGRVGNVVRRTIRKRFAKETNRIITKGGAAISSRMAGGAFMARMIPIVGWLWLGYDLINMGMDIFDTYAKGKIFMAGLLSGENQLTFVPLEYQGKDYVAGLEGILGTPRASSTILYGELTGDLTASNRGFLEMSMLARFDYDQDQ